MSYISGALIENLTILGLLLHISLSLRLYLYKVPGYLSLHDISEELLCFAMTFQSNILKAHEILKASSARARVDAHLDLSNFV